MIRKALLGSLFLVCIPGVAYAGMPTITLTEIARMRLQSISFFLVGFLLSAWAIKALWNYLRTDFTFMPRLTYPKALGVTAMWGLVFVLVLTMISGARELMTPGAWERQGLTHKLGKPETKPTYEPEIEEPLFLTRERKLDRLWVALWDYASKHDGKFPAERSLPGMPEDAWRVPDPSGMKYYYQGGSLSIANPAPVAFEPEIFGTERFVLFSNGDIKRMTSEQLVLALPKEE